MLDNPELHVVGDSHQPYPTGSIFVVAVLLVVVLGCRAQPMRVEDSRAARVRFEVESALKDSETGSRRGLPIGQVVRRINVELGREGNGLGEYFATCERLRDGLVALGKLKGDDRKKKVHELNELAKQLPSIEL
jgi:hypothetical protein